MTGNFLVAVILSCLGGCYAFPVPLNGAMSCQLVVGLQGHNCRHVTTIKRRNDHFMLGKTSDEAIRNNYEADVRDETHTALLHETVSCLSRVYHERGVGGILDFFREDYASMTSERVWSCSEDSYAQNITTTPSISMILFSDPSLLRPFLLTVLNYRQKQDIKHRSIKQTSFVTALFNSFLGMCCLLQMNGGAPTRHQSRPTFNHGADRAMDLLQMYDDMSSADFRHESSTNTSAQFAVDDHNLSCFHWAPDIVTLCLAYTATCTTHSEFSRRILERIEPFMHSSANVTSSKSRSFSLCSTADIIDVLYEDSDIIILNKPSGVDLEQLKAQLLTACYHGQSVDCATVQTRTLTPFIDWAHRLDVGTSGCVVAAKTMSAYAQLVAYFFTRQIKKSYLGLCCRPLPDSFGVANSLFVESTGCVDRPVDGRPAQTSYSVVLPHGDDQVVLPADIDRLSHYFRGTDDLHEKQLQNQSGPKKTNMQGQPVILLRLECSQGRRHQVRLHCSRGLGCPIVLDPKYGGERVMYRTTKAGSTRSWERGRISTDRKDVGKNKSALVTARSLYRFCLHAETITIPALLLSSTGMYYGREVNVRSKLPDWWEDVLREIR